VSADAAKPRLYFIGISHPSHAARLMLEQKGIEHDVVTIAPGMQAVQLRLLGFRGGTVPALRIGDRRVVGSLAISRALEALQPEPPLFPADPALRRAVEEAEAWGDRVLQPIPRRLLRHALRHDPAVRSRFAGTVGGPQKVVERVLLPVAAFYARREDAGSLDRVREDWTALPGHLDHVDGLIADGVIGGEALNAADFQIATTLRVMLASEDIAPLMHGRPAADLATRVWPEYGYRVPSLLPPELRAA
jgi:glutathione S-transferase